MHHFELAKSRSDIQVVHLTRIFVSVEVSVKIATPTLLEGLFFVVIIGFLLGTYDFFGGF